MDKGTASAEKDAGALNKTSKNQAIRNRLINVGLAVPALLLIVVALFALQEIILTLAAPAIARSAVRQHTRAAMPW